MDPYSSPLTQPPRVTTPRRVDMPRTPSVPDTTRRQWALNGAQGLPLSTRADDPRLSALGSSPTRRDVWRMALGNERADTLIDSSRAYREANPQLFEHVFDGRNIDRPTRHEVVADSLGGQGGQFHYPSALPKFFNKGMASMALVGPERIKINRESDLNTLLHEYLHNDTVGSRPQERINAYADIVKRRDGSALFQATHLPTSRRGFEDMDPVARRALNLTSRVYHGPWSNRMARQEAGSTLGELRAFLEQNGADTTTPEGTRQGLLGLQNMPNRPERINQFLDTIRAPTQHFNYTDGPRRRSPTPQYLRRKIREEAGETGPSPRQLRWQEENLDALSRMIPGIARNTAPVNPYAAGLRAG